MERLYLSRSFAMAAGPAVRFSEQVLRRAVLVYSDALGAAARLHEVAVQSRGEGGFDLELSLDEAAAPTSAAEHLFVALEARRRGIAISFLAPRLVTDPADAEELAQALPAHAAVARTLGHGLSIHVPDADCLPASVLARLSGGRLHFRAGRASWAGARQVIAEVDAGLGSRLGDDPSDDPELLEKARCVVAAHQGRYRDVLAARIADLLSRLGAARRERKTGERRA